MRSLYLVAGSFLLALTMFAQTDRGTITGTIADPAGAVVSSAKIEAKNVATSAVYEVASTDTGNYTVSQLPIGDYDLTVTVPGFKSYSHTKFHLAAGQTMREDVRLDVGQTTEAVTVTAESSLLKTDGSRVVDAIGAGVPADQISSGTDGITSGLESTGPAATSSAIGRSVWSGAAGSGAARTASAAIGRPPRRAPALRSSSMSWLSGLSGLGVGVESDAVEE